MCFTIDEIFFLQENRILADTDPTIVSQEPSVSSAVISEQLRSFNFSLEESYPSNPSTAFGPQSPSGLEDANFENECAAFADPLPFAPCCRNDRTEISTAEHNGLLDTTILNEHFNPFPADQMTFQNLGVTEGYQSIRGASKKPGTVFLNCSCCSLIILCSICIIKTIELISQ